MEYSAGTDASMRLFLASASELIKLKGIADQSLFSMNVRLSLGNTPVNRDIRKSLSNKKQHVKFPLFHNGITMIAKKVEDSDEAITVNDYVVVNGAQSLTALFESHADVTTDLKLLLRVVEVGDNVELANEITRISNNQNSIKPRDLRSNNSIQTRLQGEIAEHYDGDYYYVIKQGAKKEKGERIENDEAGRLLMAFDLQEPWNAHQIYRVFDDDYARIFGRPSVDADRIVFLHELSAIVIDSLKELNDRKVASYRLTRYFLMYCLRQVLDLSEFGRDLVARPEEYLFSDEWEKIAEFLDEVVVGIVSDFEDELSETDDEFDYKADLKSPLRVPALARSLVRTYQRDLRRKRVDDPDELFELAD